MANAPVTKWGKFSQYALQILDFTLNMPHGIFRSSRTTPPPHPPPPPPPPTQKDQKYLPRVDYTDFSAIVTNLHVC